MEGLKFCVFPGTKKPLIKQVSIPVKKEKKKEQSKFLFLVCDGHEILLV